ESGRGGAGGGRAGGDESEAEAGRTLDRGRAGTSVRADSGARDRAGAYRCRSAARADRSEAIGSADRSATRPGGAEEAGTQDRSVSPPRTRRAGALAAPVATAHGPVRAAEGHHVAVATGGTRSARSEEHTSELQSPDHLV